MTTQHNNDANFAGLAQRVTGLEAGVGDIKSTLGAIMARLDTSSKTPWGVIFSAMGVLGAALVGFITMRIEPITHDTDRLTSIVEKMNDRFMPAVDIADKFKSADAAIDKRLEVAAARRDDWQRTSESRSRDNRDDIVKLRDTMVRREEHLQHWANEAAEVAGLQRQVDEVKRIQADLYSARDVLKDDHESIRLLEQRILVK